MGDQEEDIIKNYLKELQEELTVPFTERKKQEGVKDNIEEEILTLFEEINNKEEQLNQVIELANILINKKDEMEHQKGQDLENMEQNIIQMETDMEIQKQTSNQYQRLYQETMDKNNELHQTLQHLEDQLAKQDNQQANMKKELQMIHQNDKDQLKEMIVNLQHECKKHQDQNTSYSNQIKDLMDQQEKLLANYKISSSGYEKIQYENKNIKHEIKQLQQDVKDMQYKNDILKEQLRKNEDLIQFQENEIKDVKLQKKALEDSMNTTNNTEEREVVDSVIGGGPNHSNLKTGIRGSYFSTMDEVEFRGSQFQENHSILDNDKVKDGIQNIDIKRKQKKKKQEEESETVNIDDYNNAVQQKKSQENVSQIKKKSKSNQVQKVIQQNRNHKPLLDSKPVKKYKVPPPIKKDPYEEFFELTIQAVKLDSPYMDDVLGIGTKDWYKQVQGELVPFHKWYKWVHDKIHGIREELIKSREKSLLYSKRVIIF